MNIKNTIFIAILSLFVVSVAPVLAYKSAREDSEQKNCFANQRLLFQSPAGFPAGLFCCFRHGDGSFV